MTHSKPGAAGPGTRILSFVKGHKKISVVIALFLGLTAFRLLTGQAAGPFPGRFGGPEAVYVELGQAEYGTMRDLGHYYGTLSAPSRFSLAPKVSGELREILVDIGDRLESGQVVAFLDDEEYQLARDRAYLAVTLAQAQLEEAQANLILATNDMNRQRNLSDKSVVAVSELEAAENRLRQAQARLDVAESQLASAKNQLLDADLRLSYTRVTAAWPSAPVAGPAASTGAPRSPEASEAAVAVAAPAASHSASAAAGGSRASAEGSPAIEEGSRASSGASAPAAGEADPASLPGLAASASGEGAGASAASSSDPAAEVSAGAASGKAAPAPSAGEGAGSSLRADPAEAGYRYVGARLADTGALVTALTPILDIVSLDPLLVVVDVIERDYPRIRVGMEASVRAEAYPGEAFRATVKRVAPVLSADSRQARVELEVPNPGLKLKPGMYAEAVFTFNVRENVWSVPADVPYRKFDGYVIFVADSATGTVSERRVELGLTEGGRVEIIGPEPIDGPVVMMGQHLLKDGQAYRVPGAEPVPAAGVKPTSGSRGPRGLSPS
ncbi:MAG: efflux RND transporter periplasmic adaptor subunit [Deltaproteobacteria bacterium]|jgi:multidrug efflux pump subunit AcrA (membrane-fusion protein)|nr:efflux RND transporter periplasmic adaptor subunit [Deltaproteobacteria bacterium]